MSYKKGDNFSIVVYGNLSDGFTFVGPFRDHDEAASYSFNEMGSWVATLENPAKGESTVKCTVKKEKE